MSTNEGIKYEVVKNMLGGEVNYHARSYPTGIYTKTKFIERMVSKGTYNHSEYEGILREITQTAVEVLGEGRAISISKVLKLTPVIKGGFDDADDGYQEGRNYIDVKASISKPFVKKVQDKVEVNKIAKPDIRAKVKSLEHSKTKQNELGKHFINTLKGNFFIFTGFEFKGLELRNCLNPEEKVLIKEEELNYPEFTNVGFAFTIIYNLELPAWLTDGLDIFMRLVYKAEDDIESNYIKGDYYSADFQTKWKEL